ncbi:hypothetical protein SAMD00023353_0402540 [Rosellinia necatrix]|uniref:Uncharacterized protein n=1 Tax=Rosellinia necatrix TaxID=77044 RepID=A0A1S8A5B6_ROSNE|nr:hypothetical protein SAMD00023353_0402540 [Rosellinia necatrix]
MVPDPSSWDWIGLVTFATGNALMEGRVKEERLIAAVREGKKRTESEYDTIPR